jgi:PAS domain S-box-containing protein
MMTTKNTGHDDSANLRRQAEEKEWVRAVRTPNPPQTLLSKKNRQSLHELLVYQIELEMQNEELRRTQAELVAARVRYFDLYDLAPVGYVTLSEKGLILEANLTAATLLGLIRDALVKQPISRFILKEDQNIFYRHRKQLLETHSVRSGQAGEPQTCELRMVKKDGTAFWAGLESTTAQGLSTSSGPDTDGSPVIRIVMSNISDRKQAETLRVSEERFRLLIEQAPEAIVVFDIDENRFVLANAKAEKLFGCRREELLNVGPQHFYAPIQPDGRPIDESMNNNIERVMAGEELLTERVINNAEGKNLICELRLVQFLFGDRRLIRNSFHDITERKRTEEALRASQQIIEGIIQAIPVRVFWKDKNLVYLGCNAVFAGDAGFADPKDVIGKDDYQMGWRDQAELYRDGDRQVIESGCSKFCIEEPQTTPEGNTITLLTSKIPLRNSKGEISGILGTYLDITERKQAEEEQEKLQSQLNQAQKMESVGRLAGGLAHDFNNLLGVILGRADLALEQLDPAQPLHADLMEIRTAAQRSADLTRKLLAFARRQSVAPQVLDLNEIVESMLQMLRRLIGEDLDLVWLPGAGCWPVKVDPSQIDQILANLCVNARDAIADVGKVTIETGNRVFDEADCVNHPCFISGEYVLLAVSDDGCGMDRETLACIFEPFFTTKGVGEGTGLGLATVYGIVKQNDGFINVYSEPGSGTRFTIYLPRHKGKAGPVPRERAEVPARRGHETILLAEDEPSLLKLTTVILEKQGYTVVGAGTPGEAIRLAREHPGEIHLLLTDVIMPEMNCRDLFKSLLPLYPNLKCLFMSGYTASAIAHHGVLEEGVHFIQKPFSIKDLTAKVQETLDT